MRQYRLTRAAQQDLSSIWDFTEERWDVHQAETYIREIQAAIERVAVDPGRGRARGEIREGYRSYAIGSHAIFYALRADSVDAIRNLHQRWTIPGTCNHTRSARHNGRHSLLSPSPRRRGGPRRVAAHRR